MAVKTEKELSEVSAPLAKGGGGDRVAQFRLRDLASAGNPEAGTGVSDRPPIIAPCRSDPSKSGEENDLQRLDRVAGRS